MLAGMPPIEFEVARTVTVDALKASFDWLRSGARTGGLAIMSTEVKK